MSSISIKVLVPLILYSLRSSTDGLYLDDDPKDLYIIKTTKNITNTKTNDQPHIKLKEITNITEPETKETKDIDKRLSLVDWAGYDNRDLDGPGSYAFGYDIEDAASNNIQFRSEERYPNGTVAGSYGYIEPDGNVRIVHYSADDAGFRATEENSQRGGMLKPILLEETPESTKIAGLSDKMLAALQSQKVNSKQKIEEQHTRPKDQYMISVNTDPIRVLPSNHLQVKSPVPVNYRVANSFFYYIPYPPDLQ